MQQDLVERVVGTHGENTAANRLQKTSWKIQRSRGPDADAQACGAKRSAQIPDRQRCHGADYAVCRPPPAIGYANGLEPLRTKKLVPFVW
ncbi:MAG TPA: hypothetical protein VFO94_18310 [Gammaproteobacteria bacterium]|nr:hypothetical protein [Gammaproteobacteria bacterium]